MHSYRFWHGLHDFMIRTHTYACMHRDTHVCAYLHYTARYACTHEYIYIIYIIYIYIYIYTHTHIHVHTNFIQRTHAPTRAVKSHIQTFIYMHTNMPTHKNQTQPRCPSTCLPQTAEAKMQKPAAALPQQIRHSHT